MKLSPDDTIYWQFGFLKINQTLINTWLVMGVFLVIALIIYFKLKSHPQSLSPFHNFLEAVVELIQKQIAEITGNHGSIYFPFIATLFLFIALANLLAIIPGFTPPTGSLSTTAALAFLVFIAVPIFGIYSSGLKNYLKQYMEPTPFMLPFQILSEISRTLALAVRLFGNMMSGTMIGGILLMIAPFVFPVILQLFGLLTGMIQAYIFSVLALIFINSAETTHNQRRNNG